MEFFRIKRDIPFMSYGRLTTAISLVTFILAVFFLATRGLNYSVEFTGGTVLEVQYQQSADLNLIRDTVDGLKLGEATVQSLGSSSDVMIRLPNKPGTTSAQLSEKVMSLLKAKDGTVQLRSNSLTIGAHGKVRADVYAHSIYVEGLMEGDLYGTERVHIRKSAQVRGNVTSPRVSLEDGAKFKGSIEMDPEAAQGAANRGMPKPTVQAPKPASPQPAPAVAKTGV